MEKRILSKEEVVNSGVDFDKALWFSSSSDLVLNNPEEEGGEPFNGLCYELLDNGNLDYYCYYKNGLKNGEFVEFYSDGKIESYRLMARGTITGIKTIWHKNGRIKFEGFFKAGRRLFYKKYDEDGNVIQQKTQPTEQDAALLNKFRESF